MVKLNDLQGNQAPMLYAVPGEFLDEIKNMLKDVQGALEKKAESEVNEQWIESNEARKMLGVSAKTWQTYRDNRVIPFSQFCRKIYVKRRDIEEFLQNHRISK